MAAVARNKAGRAWVGRVDAGEEGGLGVDLRSWQERNTAGNVAGRALEAMRQREA